MCTEHNSEGLWDSYSLKSHQHCSSALLLQYYHATTLSSDTSYVDNDSTMNCWRFCPRQYVSPPYIIKLVHQPPIIPTVNISFLHIKTSQHPLTASTKNKLYETGKTNGLRYVCYFFHLLQVTAVRYSPPEVHIQYSSPPSICIFSTSVFLF